MDLDSLSKLFTVLSEYWRHLATIKSKTGLTADWPTSFIPSTVLDFETVLNFKDTEFIAAISNLDSDLKTSSNLYCHSTSCCATF